MSENEPTPQTSPEDDTGRRARGALYWLVPALTFLIGLGLGAAVIAVTGDDGAREGASPPAVSPSPTPTPGSPQPTTPTGDATIVIPAACIRTAEGAEQAAGLMRRAVEAARDLNAARLQEIVDQFESLQPEIQESAEACRVAAATALPR